MMLGFGCKAALKYIPDMKELILSGEKEQTIRKCKCNETVTIARDIDVYYDANHPFGEAVPLSEHPNITRDKTTCQWHKLKPGNRLQLYWKPRTKKVLETSCSPSTFGGKICWEKQVGGCEKLGEAEVTETFTIDLWKDDPPETGIRLVYGSAYRCSPSGIIDAGGGPKEILEDLAFRDGFRDDGETDRTPSQIIGYLHDDLVTGRTLPIVKSERLSATEKFFKFFDEQYGLDKPKRFVVIRWEP